MGTDTEYQIKERLGKTTKETLKEIIENAQNKSISLEDFKSLLNKEEVVCYERNGQLTGVKFNNRKYRFKTLGMDKQAIENMAKSKEKNPEQEKVKRFHKMLDEHKKQLLKEKKKKAKKFGKEPDVSIEPDAKKTDKKKESPKLKESKKQKQNQLKLGKYVLGYDKEAYDKLKPSYIQKVNEEEKEAKKNELETLRNKISEKEKNQEKER